MVKKIRVCAGPHCSYRGSNRIMEVLEKFFGITTENKNEALDLAYCGCTGFCEQGPNVIVNDNTIYHEIKPKNIVERLETEPGEKIVTVDENTIEMLINTPL